MIENVEYPVIIDTGSGMSIMGEEIFQQYFQDMKTEESRSTAYGINGESITIRGEREFEFEIGKKRVRTNVKIATEILKEIILGNNFLKKAGAKINFEEESIQLKGGQKVRGTIHRKQEYLAVRLMSTVILRTKNCT